MSGKEVRTNGRKCFAFDKSILPYRSGVYAVSNWEITNPKDYIRYAYFFADKKKWGFPDWSPIIAALSVPFKELSYCWYGFAEEQK